MKGDRDNKKAYEQLVETFKKFKKGCTVADLTARTGLPLEQVKELVPQIVDEYSGRLEVTESGEILYSFPRGFVSKYRGFRARLRSFLKGFKKISIQVGTWLFKMWILLMLVGYFVLFVVIALFALLASTVISVSGSSDERSSSRRGNSIGGFYAISYVLDLFIRIWFYSELTRSIDQTYGIERRPPRPRGRPLHQAVFSFVFGDGDPNMDWENREKRAVLSYIQANKGIISLPEFMILTGRSPQQAEAEILSYCAQFGGTPEVTEAGTLVYQFKELLLNTLQIEKNSSGLTTPIKRLHSFSKNPPAMNRWFAILNGVNVLFGGYFLVNSLMVGIPTQEHLRGFSYLYTITYALLYGLGTNPLGFLFWGMGIVPFVFSILFYLIPLVRYQRLQGKNEEIKTENLRKTTYLRIWENPRRVLPSDVHPSTEEYAPRRLRETTEKIIKEMGTYSVPEVQIEGNQHEPVYSFPELEREKEALEIQRKQADLSAYRLGKTIFDSHGETGQ